MPHGPEPSPQPARPSAPVALHYFTPTLLSPPTSYLILCHLSCPPIAQTHISTFAIRTTQNGLILDTAPVDTKYLPILAAHHAQTTHEH